MAKTGAPTKLDETLKRIALNLYEMGKTDKQVAEICGVSEASINNWKKKDPEFFESIKSAKENADEQVEKALFERAIGYEHDSEELKTVAVGDGMSQVERHDIVKKYPPDTKAITFWLKNRRPDKWREKNELEVSGNLSHEKLSDEELDKLIRLKLANAEK